MANMKPVIIAGAGPTGLVLGLELARYGEFIMPGGFLPLDPSCPGGCYTDET